MATRPKKKRTITTVETEPEFQEPVRVIREIEPEDETLDDVLSEFGDSGVELRYYRVKPGGNEWVGTYDHKVSEAQLQEWYPDGGKFQIKILVSGELRDVKYENIASRPGGSAPGGNSTETLLRELLAEMRANRQAGPGSSVGELAEAVKAVHGLSPPAQHQSLEEQLKVSIMLAKLINGQPIVEEDNSFSGVVKDVLKQSGPAILAGIMGGGRGGHPQQPPQIAANPEDDMRIFEKNGIGFLKQKALAGADPNLYIALAIDNAQDPLYGAIVRRILTEDFSALATIDPQVIQPPYLDFFRALYDGIRSAFSEANPVDDDTRGKGGDHVDTSGNAKSRPNGKPATR